MSRFQNTFKGNNLFSCSCTRLALVFIIGFSQQNACVNSHGRIFEPPGRSTLWRLEEFQNLIPPPLENYDDDQLYCGGIGKMVTNGGKCGPCGDDWAMSKPRDNENGGTYGRGVITRNYEMGQTIDIRVELTANHWGYFEFRICPTAHHSSNIPEEDSCFDKYLLQLGDRKTRYNITTDQPGWFNMSAVLPHGLAGRAVLQWHYRAGNTWNPCEGGKSEDENEAEAPEIPEIHGSTNCGYQEIFRGCSDIFIGTSGPGASGMNPPVKPAAKPIVAKPHVVESTTGKSKSKPKATIPPMRPPKSV